MAGTGGRMQVRSQPRDSRVDGGGQAPSRPARAHRSLRRRHRDRCRRGAREGRGSGCMDLDALSVRRRRGGSFSETLRSVQEQTAQGTRALVRLPEEVRWGDWLRLTWYREPDRGQLPLRADEHAHVAVKSALVHRSVAQIPKRVEPRSLRMGSLQLPAGTPHEPVAADQSSSGGPGVTADRQPVIALSDGSHEDSLSGIDRSAERGERTVESHLDTEQAIEPELVADLLEEINVPPRAVQLEGDPLPRRADARTARHRWPHRPPDIYPAREVTHLTNVEDSE